MLTQVGVKQLTDFLRTVTAASDLVDCTLVNCEMKGETTRGRNDPRQNNPQAKQRSEKR